MKYVLLSILTFFLVSPDLSYAGNFLTVDYRAKKGESLKNIMLNFFKDKISSAGANESMAVTMKKNPSILSWNPLTYDVEFKLYVDPSRADFKKVIEYKQKDAHHLNLSSMPSYGQFSQSNNTGYNVKYNQISFFSIGLGYLYAPYKKPLHMSASIYYSSIAPAANQISGGESSSVDIPAEYGVNVYGIYKPDSNQFSFFSGLDFERFSSFNIQNILSNNTIVIDTNTVYYLTAGANFRPDFIEKMTLKLSFSKSIFTDFSSAVTSNNKVQLSGLKVLVFVNYHLDEKWSVNMMYKSHSFSGDNDLSINRLGVGVSYLLF